MTTKLSTHGDVMRIGRAVRDDDMGARIRMLRESKKLSQEVLAGMIGVSKGTVCHWETGRSANINLRPFLVLCTVLGASVEYVVYGPDGMPTRVREEIP